MKNIRILLQSALSVSLLLGGVACTENILETEPQTQISERTAFSTPAKILAQVNNLYAKLQVANFYGSRFVLFNEQRGEEFSQNDGNASVGALIWQQNALSSDNFVNGLWSAAYTAINASNIFIQEVSNTSVITSPLREQYVAEAKFTRALSYLVLVQTYAKPFNADNGASLGVPLRLSAETSEGNNDLARSTVAQVYNQILQDLNEAEKGLPETYSTPTLNASRAHKATAIALKTRVLLAKGDYAGVVTEAKKIVSTIPPFQYVSGTLTHRLEANVATLYSGTYVGGEAVFSILFNNIDAPGTQGALAYNYLGAVVLSLNPVGIGANPALAANSTDARSKLITTKNAQRVSTKFPKITTPYTDFIPVIRYAEVLLNYAEAAAETGDLSTATALLSAVRNRSDAAFVFSPEATVNKAALVQTILTERRIELLGEGHRAPDLQRRVQILPAKAGAVGSAPQVLPADRNYIWPIPSDELATNKLIQPNP